MRILFLSSIVPFPPHDGGRIRTYELMRGLAAVHDVELLTLTDGCAEERESLVALRAEGLRVDAVTHDPDRRIVAVRSLLTARSLNGSLVRSRALTRRVRERLAGGDVDSVQCEYSSMAVYRPDESVPWVLDAQNVEFRISAMLADTTRGFAAMAYRAYSRREARRRRAEEIAAWSHMDHVAVVSEVDRAILEELAPGTATTVVHNCVNLPEPPASSRPTDRPSAVFIGKMDYRPNVDGVCWFSEEILPLVRVRVPQFELTIAGRDATPAVRALDARAGVRFVGRVPETAPLLYDASLAVVPLRAGSGSRLKVLEALAAGTPVVTTSLGVEGLEVRHGVHVVVADDAATFADAIVELLADPQRRVRIAQEGRRLVEERYQWPQAVRALVDVHERAVEHHRLSRSV